MTGKSRMPTWPSIVQFLIQNKKAEGVVIFLDELDKLSGSSSWEAFERTEIFKLLDLAIPSGITDGDDDTLSDYDYLTAKEVLSNRTMIIGAGALGHTTKKLCWLRKHIRYYSFTNSEPTEQDSP